MKVKKAQKIEAALVVVLEFVRVMASTNPQATAETLQKMGVNENIFAPCVNRLVKIALKNADEGATRICDVLKAFRKEVKRREAAGENTNLYAATDDDEFEPDDNEE